MNKVSIVIPNYNQLKYLKACVDNCYFQTYSDIELIIVDGGSTDGTKEYLENLENKIATQESNPVVQMDASGNIIKKRCLSYHEDTHAVHPKREIKILAFDQDIGRTATYNKGFKQVTGSYCTYIVGDDIPHPHMIEDLVCVLEKTGTDVVYSDFNIVTDSQEVIRLVRKPDYSFEECFAKWYHLGVSTLYRSEWLQKTGYMDETFQIANDYAFFLKLAMNGASFHHIPRVLYSVRFHGQESLLDESKNLSCKSRNYLIEKANHL